MKIFNKTKNLTLLIFIFASTAGCDGQYIIASPSEFPTPSSETSFLINSTITPSSSSPAPHPTGTWTPVPTYSETQALETLLRLYKSNGGCELPCWWGLSPGYTLFSNFIETLSPITQIYGPYGSRIHKYEIHFSLPEEIDPFGSYGGPGLGSGVGADVDFWFDNNILVAIGVNSYLVKNGFDFSLAGLLNYFGQPEEIWLNAVARSPDEQPYYQIDLFYGSQGILVSMSGNSQLEDGIMEICPQNIFSRNFFPPVLLLWSSERQISYNQIGWVLLDDLIGWNKNDYVPLSSWTSNFSPDDFYNTYKVTNTNTCFFVNNIPNPTLTTTSTP